MDFCILGRIEVLEHGSHVAVGGARQRALLALLVIHANETLHTERLIDQLWGEHPPATAAKTVQVNISRLRKALEPPRANGRAELIVTREHGYELRVDPERIDARKFERLIGEGRRELAAGRPDRALSLLEEALSLWRGRPLAELAYERFAQDETARLDELHVGALEELVEARLALGGHVEAAGTLEGLVREHPYRERLRAQLMLALYRCDRQAAALQVYHDARRTLVEELGIEPGQRLRELERAILSQDPSLALSAVPAVNEPVVPKRSRRLPARMAGVATALLIGVLAAVLLLGGGAVRRASLQPDSLGLVDPHTGHLRASVAVAGTPARVHVSGRRVWVTSDGARTISLAAAGAPGIARVAQIGAFPSDFAVGEGGVWIVDRQGGSLAEVSEDYLTVLHRHAIGSSNTVTVTDDRNVPDPWSLAAGAGGVWITDGSQMLRRADPVSGAVVRTFHLPVPADGVAVGNGSLWAISGPASTVLGINPESGKVVTRIPIVARPGLESPYPIAVAAGLGSVWVLNANSASVTRIDPVQRGVTATIPIGIQRAPRRLAVGAGAAWVADGDGTLARIDAGTNAVTFATLAASLYDVAVGAGGVWVTSGNAIAGQRIAEGEEAAGGAEPLPSSNCSPIYSAPGARPRYLVASVLPLQGLEHDVGAQATAAIAFELRQRGFRAGRFAIGYQACNQSSIASADPGAGCASNMRAYATDRSVIGIVGPFNSGCAAGEIGIANRAPGGPLAMISPSTTYVGLTRHGPGATAAEPGVYYPTGVRNYARIVPADDAQAAADAVLAKQLGRHRVFVTEDNEAYGQAIAHGFAVAAQRLGVGLAGHLSWPSDADTAAFARAVAQSHPDAILLSGFLSPSVGPMVRALRAAMPGVQFLAPDAFAFFPDVVDVIGPAAEGLLASEPEIYPSLLPGAGRQFVAKFGRQIGGSFYPTTAYAAQAANVLLDAISRSDATRGSVTKALFATRVRDGIIGSFTITPTGDTTAGGVTIIQVEHGQPLPRRVITPPPSLLSSR